MNLATKFTLLRVILIPVFMLCFYLGCWYNIPALAVFVIASITDYVDGYIARKYNQISDLGKFLDPLADKLLVFAAILMLTEFGRFPAWAAMILLAREFAVSGLRMIAAAKGSVIAAGWSGKVKTASTMVGLCVLIVINQYIWLDYLVLAIIALTTLISGVEYFMKNWKVLR